jgi:putative chitinase
MLTDDQLQAIMPALPKAKRTIFVPVLNGALTEFSIQSPARQAAFLAQLAHESGELRFMQELWGPTPAQLRYEPQSTLASRLGNTEAGDGKPDVQSSRASPNSTFSDCCAGSRKTTE